MAARGKMAPEPSKHAHILLYEALWECLDDALLERFMAEDPKKAGLEEQRFFDVVSERLLGKRSFTSAEVNAEVARWRQAERRELLRELRKMLCYGDDYTWDYYVHHLSNVLATEDPNFVQRFKHRATVRCQNQTNKTRLKSAIHAQHPLRSADGEGRGKKFLGLQQLRAAQDDGQGDAAGEPSDPEDSGGQSGSGRHGAAHGASHQRAEPILSIVSLPELGDAWGAFLCCEQHGVTLRHGRDFEVIGRLPETTSTVLAACAVDSPHYQLAISYDTCGIHLLNLQERAGDAIKIKYVLQASVPQHCLTWAAKTGRLLSGGSNGEISAWSMSQMTAFTGQIRPVQASDMLLANDMIETRGFHRDIFFAANEFNMEGFPARDALKFMLALLPLFGLSHGQALWLAENQASAHLYLGALAQVRDIPPRVFRSLMLSCMPASAPPAKPGDAGADDAGGSPRPAARDAGSMLAWAMKAHADVVTWLLFGDNANCLVSASRDGTVAVIDLELRQKLYTLKGQQRGVMQIDFAPAAGLLASVGYTTAALVWDLQNPVERPMVLQDTASPHSERVVRVLFVPDMPQVVTCDQRGLIKVWDYRRFRGHGKVTASQNIDTGVQLPPCDRKCHNITSMVYMPRSQLLVLIGRNLCFYEPRKLANPNAAGEGPAVEVNYNSYSRRFVSITGGQLSVWDADQGVVTGVHTISDGHAPPNAAGAADGVNVTCACSFGDSVHTIIGTSTGALALVKSTTGRVTTQLQNVHARGVVGVVPCSRANGLAYLVSVDKGGVVALCNKNLKLVFSYRLNMKRGDAFVPSCLCDCPATSQIAVGSTDGTLLFFDPSSLANVGVLYRVKTTFSEVCSLAQIGSLPCLAVASAQGVIGIWGMKPVIFINELPIVKWLASPKGKRGGASPMTPAGNGAARDTAVAAGAAVTIMKAADHMLFTGDEEGRISAWNLDVLLSYTGIPGIVARQQEAGNTTMSIHHVKSKRGYQSLKPAWARHVYNCDVLCLVPLSPCYLITSANDGRVFILHAHTGDFVTSLAQGRGIRAIQRSHRVHVDDISSAPAPWKAVAADAQAPFEPCVVTAEKRQQKQQLLCTPPSSHPSSFRTKRSENNLKKQGVTISVPEIATPASDAALPPSVGPEASETGTASGSITPTRSARHSARDGAMPPTMDAGPRRVTPPEPLALPEATQAPGSSSPVAETVTDTDYEEQSELMEELRSTTSSDAAAADFYRRRRRQLKARLRDTHNPMTRLLVNNGHAPKVRPASARVRGAADRKHQRQNSAASARPPQPGKSAMEVVREPVVTNDQVLTLRLYNEARGTRADDYECSHRGVQPYLKDQRATEERAVRAKLIAKEETRKAEHRFCYTGVEARTASRASAADDVARGLSPELVELTALELATCRRTPVIPDSVRRQLAWGRGSSSAASSSLPPSPAVALERNLFTATPYTGGRAASVASTPTRPLSAASPVMIPSPPTRPPDAYAPQPRASLSMDRHSSWSGA
eukprot:TRINITY_DN19142_c0_g1_i1.p1 TRINITY_DN19142_c0_g1~~TRINITY_DN19142_c0_g1_i1.p1  ORF type:complete len:1501 (+),score=455.68 TRINITY_DN19142_c0_g1_i1:144-4646(+)